MNPTFKREFFRKKFGWYIERRKYVFKEFINELKMTTIFVSKYISLSMKFTTPLPDHLFFKENSVTVASEE
jgi:hypothetical protein